MSNYSIGNNYNCNHNSNYNIVSGNSLDVNVNNCESEIRADVVVAEYNSVRLWGRVLNCDGKPVANALIKLLKVNCCNDNASYKGIAHTISDCNGFYQFELCSSEEDNDACYKILVSKAAYGPERIIPISGGNCDPCNDNNGYPFDPCKEYPPIITPPGNVGTGSTCCEDSGYGCGCNSGYSKSKY